MSCAGEGGSGEGAGGGGLGGTCTLTPFGKASPTEMAMPRAKTEESAREREARMRSMAERRPNAFWDASLRGVEGAQRSEFGIEKLS